MNDVFRNFLIVVFIITVTGHTCLVAQNEVLTDPPVKAGTHVRNCLDERPKGFYNVTSFSIFSFSGNWMNGMQTICGYKFSPHLGLGGGIGIERFTNLPTYSNYSGNFTLIPVFADFRYTILKTKVSPVIAVDAGYKFLINIPSSQMVTWTDSIYPSYAWNDYYLYDTYLRGGPFITVEIGVQARVYKRIGLSCSVDYSLWSVSGDNHYWVYQYVPGDPGTVKAIVNEYVEPVLAYQHVFLIRFGFTF
jgi:hypothetical protein